jgi:hypothetical protein
MTKTYVDSDKLKDAGNDLVTLGMEYTEIINTLFDKINGYSSADIWVGKSAEDYIALVNTEKSTYDSVGSIINSYGKVLINIAEDYENYMVGTDYNG